VIGVDAVVSSGLMRNLFLIAMAFVVMEPMTAAAHRWIMHGVGRALHRSHHRQHVGRFEANDAYPVMFAAVVCLGLWAGFNVSNLSGLVPIGIGITLYGGAYGVVHDVYIHGRTGLIKRRFAILDRLADAHRIHHLYNGAPYGMLVPVVPRRLRERAARSDRDPLQRSASRADRQRVTAVPGA